MVHKGVELKTRTINSLPPWWWHYLYCCLCWGHSALGAILRMSKKMAKVLHMSMPSWC